MSDLDATQPVPFMPAGDEIETLLSTIDRNRATFSWKCSGLDAAGTNARLGSSTLTLGGLLKHMALIEDHYFTSMLAGQPMPAPWNPSYDGDGWEWRSAPDDSPEELLQLWRDSVTRSRKVVADALAKDGLDTVAASPTHGGASLNLRRIIADLIEEYARHTGHADLLRESVDGLVGEDSPEGWQG